MIFIYTYDILLSHPSRVRGLKSADEREKFAQEIVAPLAGAWIEMPLATQAAYALTASHPSRVRGLKFNSIALFLHSNAVAPLAGAWIEIFVYSGAVGKVALFTWVFV